MRQARFTENVCSILRKIVIFKREAFKNREIEMAEATRFRSRILKEALWGVEAMCVASRPESPLVAVVAALNDKSSSISAPEYPAEEINLTRQSFIHLLNQDLTFVLHTQDHMTWLRSVTHGDYCELGERAAEEEEEEEEEEDVRDELLKVFLSVFSIFLPSQLSPSSRSRLTWQWPSHRRQTGSW
jgi:hypothetical protein